MTMRTPAVIMIAVLLLVKSATAQTISTYTGQPQVSAFGVDPTIRIAAQFRVRIEGVTDPRDVPDAKAQAAARRALYEMAANECAALSEIWKAECRLGSFSITAVVFPSNNTPQNAVMTGAANYELRPKGSASGR
jgi:hypothetical protein